MTEGMFEHTHSRLESDLAAFYSSPVPEDFAERLREQLQERARELHAARQGQAPWWRRFLLSHRPALAFALVVLLILASVAAAVGPQRVLAAVQQLLGYVPGMGFVDLDGARMLESPVSISREGVTFKLVQLIAQPDKTLVAFRIEGLPEIIPQDNQNDEFYGGFNPRLSLPNGEGYGLTQMEYGGEGNNLKGKITFPQIPMDVQHAWLEFDSLPDIPSGEIPEGWQIPFTLGAVKGSLPAEGPVDIFVPSGASASANGVTMELVQVARSSTETAIHLRFGWEDLGWSYARGSIPMLKDDIGHFYPELTMGSGIAVEEVVEIGDSPLGTPTGSPPINYLDETYLYQPLSSAARKITLILPNMMFTAPANASFTIDLGDNPKVGQSWEIDQWIRVAGIDVYIPAVHLAENISKLEPGEEKKEYLLKFIMQPQTLAEKSLVILNAEMNSADYFGASLTTGGDTDPLFAALHFASIPKGKIELFFPEAQISIPGPWEISLDLPDFGEEQARVQVLHPQVSETHHGITVSIAEVLRSDLMTLVKIALPDLPPGAKLVSIADDEISLEDSAGRKLKLLYKFDPAHWLEFDPSELRFASSLDSPGDLTLQVPAVEVFYPGETSLVVEVPEGLTFHEEKEDISESIEGKEYHYSRSRWISDPWPVDLPVEIAGYHIGLNKARLERDEDDLPHLYRLEIYAELPAVPPNMPFLRSLRAKSIIRPDGKVNAFDYGDDPYGTWGNMYSWIGPKTPGSTDWVATLQFDVTSADRFNLLPGTYVINLAGAVVAVPGPWRLSWPGQEP